jgi:hypothetical protein
MYVSFSKILVKAVMSLNYRGGGASNWSLCRLSGSFGRMLS